MGQGRGASGVYGIQSLTLWYHSQNQLLDNTCFWAVALKPNWPCFMLQLCSSFGTAAAPKHPKWPCLQRLVLRWLLLWIFAPTSYFSCSLIQTLACRIESCATSVCIIRMRLVLGEECSSHYRRLKLCGDGQIKRSPWEIRNGYSPGARRLIVVVPVLLHTTTSC